MSRKAVISNRIYFKPTTEELVEIKKALTYKIPINMGAPKTYRPGAPKMVSVEVIRNYKALPGGIYSIPRERTDLIPEDIEIVDKRISYDMPFPIPTKPLYEQQLEVYNAATGTCFINAMVGWGKTFMALHLARKLGQKTLVVTHTTILRDQWISEAKALYNMPIGKIGSGEYDIDHVIVIGNTQSVSKYTSELSKEFGTIIIDEAHHCPATTFTNIIDSSYAKYRIALSGTMIRRDGKHILFKDYFGTEVHKPPQNNTLTPKVRLVSSPFGLEPGIPWARKINNLLYDVSYQKFIAALARYEINQKNRSVLIIADRIDFLTNVKDLIGDDCMLAIGGPREEDRAELSEKINSGEKKAIAGQRSIFSEGISINRLDTVILATPIASEPLLEQIIGRIQRLHKDKVNGAEVIDIQFSGPSDKKQNKLRLGFYLQKGWITEKY